MKTEKRRKQFADPPREYRGKPFWSWNGKLEKQELLRQIDIMKEMGFGGYFMHSRTGLETEYLGEEWFRLINDCADYGWEQGMESWLYDEDRWPSGSAGGMVTKEEKYRAMYIDMKEINREDWNNFRPDAHTIVVFGLEMGDQGIFSGKRILAPGNVLDEKETPVVFCTRYAACHENYNGHTYVDTMNREAIQQYLALTHEKYRGRCGDRLGRSIPGIFTDEPNRGGTFTGFASEDQKNAVNSVPYTPGLFEEFKKRFGYDLKELLPELFLRRKEGELSRVTRDYFELCQELFLECFAIPISEWCRENHMLFTGHVLHEDSLCAQTVMQGSLMRFYEYMDCPGIDVLTERNECYWVAKQVESVARQLQKEWVLSELYGATGWQMDFESYKNVGDWQALLGVNLRCPHLSWYTMKGEAKRDYPASILHQSSWYPDFHYLEDYYSRIHVALHGGRPVCSLLVLNPVESVWARSYSGAFDGLDGLDAEIVRLEKQYADVFHMLMAEQIDFDYGEEDILSRHGRVEGGVLYVGAASYRKVLVAGMDTMRTSTLALLQELSRQGGEVIFLGRIPTHVDVLPSDQVQRLAEISTRIRWEERELAECLKNEKIVGIDSEGKKEIYVQAYDSEDGRMVMLLNTNRDRDFSGVKLHFNGEGSLEQWNPRNGEITVPPYQVENGEILLTIDLEKGGERLYRIFREEGILREGGELSEERREPVPVPEKCRYHLTERNVCVLDMVEVHSDKGVAIPLMEVLKADRVLRDSLGISWRGGEMLQPWYQIKYKGGNSEALAWIALQYVLNVETLPRQVSLAVEGLEHIRKILVNGRAISMKSQRKWVDICFDEVDIPDEVFHLGENTVTIEMQYYKISGIEAVYLLGNFGVKTEGDRVILINLPDTLKIGDLAGQGLPFYSGSVIYEISGPKDCQVSVTAQIFGGALLKLLGDTTEIIAFPPYQASVKNLKGVQVVLTRRNTFGPLHEIPKKTFAYAPVNFVTEGENWSRGYQLYEQGLLEKPVILK